MAFPTVVETLLLHDSGAEAGDVDVPIGTSMVAGDLLLVGVAHGDANEDFAQTAFAAVSGWTQFIDNDILSAGHMAWYKRKSTGDESTPLNVVLGDGVTDEVQFCAIFLRIDKDTWSGDIDEVERSGGTEGADGLGEGFGTSADPLAPTASWGADDNLFCCTLGCDDDDGGITAYPSGFDDVQALAMNEETGGAQVRLAFAAMESANASEDPGAWTLPASEQWCSAVWVIRGAGGAPPAGVAPQAAHHYRARRAG